MKSPIRWASFSSLFVAALASAQTVHISHCLAGCPIASSNMVVDNNELVVRQLFAASINGENGRADWQAYRVLAGSVGVASLLPREWYEDSLVGQHAIQAESADGRPQFVQPVSTDAEERSYQLSVIQVLAEDQGRLVPMTSFAGTPYWSELNYLSNMAPLPFDLRVGSWSRLDQAINALADSAGEVYVLSGPIYESGDPSDGEGLSRPNAYFKVVSTANALSAFVFQSDVQQHVNFCQQISSLEAIEAATGLDLFPQKESDFAATLHDELTCNY
ncbi:MAG: DNA/RNA non-specific endonuclease [Pseudohongiellaceae bacterium]